MTPPNAVGYANGIAQSIVSLARCIGPSLGGYVSIGRNLSDYNRLKMRLLDLGSEHS